MKISVVVPVRSLTGGKSRLRPILSDARREALCRLLLNRTLTACVKSRAIFETLVVTSDPEVVRHAIKFGVPALLEKSNEGLNAAAEYGRAQLRDNTDVIVIIPADLPRISHRGISRCIQRIRELRSDRTAIIAPDHRERGTNLIALPSAAHVTYAFGENSFQIHQAACANAALSTLVERGPEFTFDIDLPEDFEAWRRVTAMQGAKTTERERTAV